MVSGLGGGLTIQELQSAWDQAELHDGDVLMDVVDDDEILTAVLASDSPSAAGVPACHVIPAAAMVFSVGAQRLADDDTVAELCAQRAPAEFTVFYLPDAPPGARGQPVRGRRLGALHGLPALLPARRAQGT